MLSRLSAQVFSAIPRRMKVTRPDFPRYHVGHLQLRQTGKQTTAGELVIGFLVFSAAMLGPPLYMASEWKYYRNPE
ncbi:unnamed protein product [Clavelina lepadiformis]|uniref:Uncharacterized protein n=1 Tax=Clavelina lepadiformis TaxID=159417 RepID=A0ABP0GE11_CLALP